LRRKRKVPIGHVWPGEPLGPHIPILVDAAVTRRDDDQTLRRRGRIRMRTAAPATKGRKEEGARPESECSRHASARNHCVLPGRVVNAGCLTMDTKSSRTLPPPSLNVFVTSPSMSP